MEGRIGDLKELTGAIHDPVAAEILEAERAILKVIGGGCNAPAAAFTKMDGNRMIIKAMYANDGKHPKYVQIIGKTGEETGRKAGEAIMPNEQYGHVTLVGAGPGRCRTDHGQRDRSGQTGGCDRI